MSETVLYLVHCLPPSLSDFVGVLSSLKDSVRVLLRRCYPETARTSHDTRAGFCARVTPRPSCSTSAPTPRARFPPLASCRARPPNT